MKPWTFVHVCDIQVGSPRSFRFKPAWNENWQTARKQIVAIKPEVLLVGGDLTRDGSVHDYELANIKADLHSLPFPCYAVPGNIFVFELACKLIKERAKTEGISLKCVPGISSIESVYAELGIDPVDGMHIISGKQLAASKRYVPEIPSIVVQPFLWDGSEYYGIQRLKTALMEYLPSNHPITIVSHTGWNNVKCQHFNCLLRDIDSLSTTLDPNWTIWYIPPKAE